MINGLSVPHPTSIHAFKAYDALLVKHCAAVIASLRPANLLVLRCRQLVDQAGMDAVLRHYRREFKDSSLKITTFYRSSCEALVYLYDPQAMMRWLNHIRHRLFLIDCGYRFEDHLTLDEQLRRLLDQLRQRIAAAKLKGEDFPHEIGIFLGYPFEDVMGFIQKGSQEALCTGYWKVYQNPNQKMALFKKIRQWEDRFVKAIDLGSRPRALVRSTVLRHVS